LEAKGKVVNFFETGDELFQVVSRIEDELKVNSFFVMDENFLLHHERAMRLLKLMEAGNKSWALSVFASANAIRKYTMQELVELGVSWLWMGLESPQAGYSKLQGADTRQLRARIARAWDSRAGIDHHRAGASHPGQHHGGNRACRFARY
jgi:hypothetical protein